MADVITKNGVVYSPTCIIIEKKLKDLAKKKKISLSALLTRALQEGLEIMEDESSNG